MTGRSMRYAIVGVVLAIVAALGVMTVAGANGGDTKASLRDAGGKVRGTVTFKSSGGHTEVRVRLVGLPESVARDAFHGFHIHANSDASNGDGCLADATKAANTWFVSADGHWKADAQVHSGHNGDMPSVLVTPDGAAEMRFETGRIDLGQLRGRAVVLHAGADNFANVPLGTGDAQYTANTAAATTATQNTGNAGDRILCGVIGA